MGFLVVVDLSLLLPCSKQRSSRKYLVHFFIKKKSKGVAERELGKGIPPNGGGGSVEAGEGEALLGGLLPRRMGSRAAGPHDVDAAPGRLQAQVRRRCLGRRILLLGLGVGAQVKGLLSLHTFSFFPIK